MRLKPSAKEDATSRKQIDNRGQPFHLTFVALGVLAVVAIVGFGTDSSFDREPNRTPASTGPVLDSQSEGVAPQTPAPPSRAAPLETAASDSDLKHFTPGKVLDNPECRMTVDPRVPGDIAVVVLPAEDGARFAAIDSNGPLFARELPFRPRRFQVVRRRDGSVLTVFTDIYHALLDDGFTERRGFAVVHLDRKPIRFNVAVRDLQLAPDGSSWFATSTHAGVASQVGFRNLDLGLGGTYFFDALYFGPPSSHRAYSAYYSRDASEIMLVPGYEGVGKHHFLSTGPSYSRRIIDVTGIADLQTAYFTSSEAGFFITYDREEKRSELFRRDFEWQGSDWRSVDRWLITLPEGVGFDSPMPFSPDGSMLLAHGEETLLIDTEDGDLLLRFPTQDNAAQLSRLVHILGPDATEVDVGDAEWPFFRGEQLLLPREFEGTGEQGNVRRVFDVFDLANISIDSGTDFRLYEKPGGCRSIELGPARLREEEGRLVYGFGG